MANRNSNLFNAPYGIIEYTIEGNEGSVICYVVSFGCAGAMDATTKVFSDSQVEFDSRGYYDKLNGIYKNVDELIETLSTEIA